MKHLKKGRVFGREKNQRSALIKGLMRSLVEHERVVTTEAKAKSLRSAVEKVITRGKKNNLQTIRYLRTFLSKELTRKVGDVLSPRYQSRQGGYTRIVKLPPRKSDGSPIAIIEFVK